MKRSISSICLFAVISLIASAIWPNPALAAVAPVIESLGQIREGLAAPGKVDLDAEGNLYVADARDGSVTKFDQYGRQVGTFSQFAGSGQGLAATPDGNTLYVAGADAVGILDARSGALLGHLGVGAGEFGSVGEIDLDADGRIFVVDGTTLYIRIYDTAGNYLYQFGGPGTTAGKFLSIWAMTVDQAANEIYVADSQGQGTSSVPKVQVFDLSGGLLRSLTAASGFGTPNMVTFAGMTFDNSGRGYFLDKTRSELRMLSLPSQPLAAYANPGYDPGQLSLPADAVFDSTNSRLFISCEPARIEILGIDGGQNPVYVNHAPTPPVPISPVAASSTPTATPELVFANATDEDADVLTYEIEINGDGQVVETLSDIAEGTDTTSAFPSSALLENAAYTWKVRAFDGAEYSAWSALNTFYVNAVQEPPAVPVLVAPLAGEILGGDDLLDWQAASDPDPFDSVSYILEIAADQSFAVKDLDELLDATSISLAELVGYPALEEGLTYFWRITAVDNHGSSSQPSAAGSFRYDTTFLRVTANMPGARVYLGGNHGYSGRFVGETPLELTDLPAGPCSVVVERAGFEPFLAQVNPLDRENVEVYAQLVPLLVPAAPRAFPLMAGTQKLNLAGDAAPFLVDFDNDGYVDLLTGDAAGAITLFKGIEGQHPAFAAGTTLGLPLLPGASPFVADWDNDGRKDLLVGAGDGTLTLFINAGTEAAPAFGSGAPLTTSGGAPIAVEGDAVPAVLDIDGDGAKDLVVGSAAGDVFLYQNLGEDSAPLLAPAVLLASVGSPAAPCFTDWDGDGVRELLLSTGGAPQLCKRQPDGTFAVQAEAFSDNPGPVGKRGKKGTKALELGERVRIFALDADLLKGKDVVVGNASGEMIWLRGNGRTPDASFNLALRDKVGQIDQLSRETGGELTPMVASIDTQVATAQFKTAAQLTTTLKTQAPAGTELAQAVAELETLLKYAR